MRPLARHRAVGDHVRDDAREPADHRAAPEADMLMHRREPAHDDEILNHAMPREGGVVGHDHPVADDAVMGDMGGHHEEVVVAHHRAPAAALGAGAHGGVLADRVARADMQLGGLAAILQVLRHLADGGEGEDLRLRADRCNPVDGDMAVEHHAFGQRDPWPDDAIGADPAPGPDLRAFLDDGGGVDVG